MRVATAVLLCCAAACTRPSTLLITVNGLPVEARSMAVSLAVQNEGAAPLAPMQDLLPYELPQPVTGQTDFVLRLPLSNDATLLLGVAAFSEAAGQGCLLALGSAEHPYRASITDDSVTIEMTASVEAGPSCQAGPRITAVTPTLLGSTGGETLKVVGWGFVPDARIVLNGTALQTRYVFGGQLEATVPPSSRFMAVPLKVELPDGTSLSYSGLRYQARLLSFAPLTVINVPDAGYRVTTADLDGDQRLDLIFYPSPFSLGTDVIIAYQRAPLQFTPEVQTTIGDASELSALDVDRDGDIDLVALSANGRTLKILKNDGRATLTLTSHALSVTAALLHCVDLDGDGAPEVSFLQGSGVNQRLYTLRNDGSGGYDPLTATITRLMSTPDAAVLFSLDHDKNGRADLWYWNDTHIAVLKNPGAAPPMNDAGAELIVTYDLSSDYAVKDLDGDKLPDLLTMDLYGNPYVFLSGSNPPWEEQDFRVACPEALYTVGDLDGDELPDAAYGCTIRQEVRFYRQLASNRFVATSQAPALPLPLLLEEIYALRLSDLDADGKPELIIHGGQSSGGGPTGYYVFHNISQ